MSYLTERQKEILEYIQGYRRERGIAPTHREICEKFGFSSYGTAYKHLKLLQQKGFLRRDWNQKRGIELIRAIPGVYKGKHVTHQKFSHVAAKCISIETSTPAMVQLDGELVGQTPVQFSVLPAAIALVK